MLTKGLWAEQRIVVSDKQVIVIVKFYQISVNSGTKVVRTTKSLTETEHIFVFTWFAINELI